MVVSHTIACKDKQNLRKKQKKAKSSSKFCIFAASQLAI